MKSNKTILFVVNVDWFFLSHRLPLAKEAIKRGYSVYLASKNTGHRNKVEELGVKFIELDFDRSGRNPIREFNLIIKLRALFISINPDIIHQVTIKPSIYGSIAYRFTDKKAILLNAISGLGYNFIDERNPFSQKIIIRLMKFAFGQRGVNFIFQNPDDLNYYKSKGYLLENNHKLIKGAGVDETQFNYSEKEEAKILSVLLTARMLKDKGVFEFIYAAQKLKNKWFGKAKFILVGDIDVHNPASVTKDEITQLLIKDYLVWVGHQSDVRPFLLDSDIVCLPSYREGLPKSLIEAMAIGRPIITTDVPGCRECVVDGYNGYLVPPKNVLQLAEKIDALLLDRKLRLIFGVNSRKKMVKELSLSKVVSATFNFYEELTK